MRLIKKILALFGYKIQRVDTPMRSLERGLQNLARVVKVDTVIDVGVANGTPELYKAFKGRKFILFEADPYYRPRLQELEQEIGALTYSKALGDHDGSITLNSTSAIHGAYSSVYTPHRDSKPVEVPLARLDSALPPQIGNFVLKIDVEGAELDVLKGSVGALSACKAIVVEVSIQQQRFEQGAIFSDVILFLKQHGFEIFDLLAGAMKNGQLYQLDAVFLRR